MPKFLASYDLRGSGRDPHHEFMQQAPTCGWSAWIEASNNNLYKLPNTTLVGEFATQDEAFTHFFLIASLTSGAGYPVDVVRWIIVEYSNSTFNSPDVLPPNR